ncbi:hypothetical protein EAE96_007678 [Botrytis aclada]|nr:hypothetical protein EAE96_007678 [Botrytis aclada]
MTLHNTRSQRGKKADTVTPHVQKAQGMIDNNNNARSGKEKEVGTNTTLSEPQMKKVFETIHKLASDLHDLRQGVAAVIAQVPGYDRPESRIGDLSMIKDTVDACDTPLHAVVSLMQLKIDLLRSATEKAKFMVDGNSSNDGEEERGEGFEDGDILEGSTGSDILAVPKGSQQPPHKQVDQSKASVVGPSAAAYVAHPFIPRVTAELSAQSSDVNCSQSAKVALDNAATSSGAGTLRRSKRVRDTTQNQKKDKRQRRF